MVSAPRLELGRPYGQGILSLLCIILHVRESMGFCLYRKIVNQCFHHFVFILVRTYSYYIALSIKAIYLCIHLIEPVRLLAERAQSIQVRLVPQSLTDDLHIRVQ